MKNDVRDASDLADLLRIHRLPEAWIAPPTVRELRELVRYRAKLVAIRSGFKAQVHGVLDKAGLLIAASDLFGGEGRQQLQKTPLAGPYAQRVASLLHLIDVPGAEEAVFTGRIGEQLREHDGYRAIQALLGVGPSWQRSSLSNRRRHPVRWPGTVVLMGRIDTTPLRIRHCRAPRTYHQTRQQTRPLGHGGSDPTQDHRQDCRRSNADRSSPRQEHREDRCGTKTAHPCLLRLAGRRDPRVGQGCSVSCPDAACAWSSSSLPSLLGVVAQLIDPA